MVPIAITPAERPNLGWSAAPQTAPAKAVGPALGFAGSNGSSQAWVLSALRHTLTPPENFHDRSVRPGRTSIERKRELRGALLSPSCAAARCSRPDVVPGSGST